MSRPSGWDDGESNSSSFPSAHGAIAWVSGVAADAQLAVAAASPISKAVRPWTLNRFKLAAGGFLGRRDASALLALGDRDALVSEVEAHISDVRPDGRDVWNQVLASAT